MVTQQQETVEQQQETRHTQRRQEWQARMKEKLEPGVDANPFPHVGLGLALIQDRIEQLTELGSDGDGPELHLLASVAQPALRAVIGVLQQCNSERGYSL